MRFLMARRGVPKSFASQYPKSEDIKSGIRVKIRRGITDSLSDNSGKLLKTQFAITILVGFHDRLIDDLLKLRILGW